VKIILKNIFYQFMFFFLSLNFVFALNTSVSDQDETLAVNWDDNQKWIIANHLENEKEAFYELSGFDESGNLSAKGYLKRFPVPKETDFISEVNKIKESLIAGNPESSVETLSKTFKQDIENQIFIFKRKNENRIEMEAWMIIKGKKSLFQLMQSKTFKNGAETETGTLVNFLLSARFLSTKEFAEKKEKDLNEAISEESDKLKNDSKDAEDEIEKDLETEEKNASSIKDLNEADFLNLGEKKKKKKTEKKKTKEENLKEEISGKALKYFLERGDTKIIKKSEMVILNWPDEENWGIYIDNSIQESEAEMLFGEDGQEKIELFKEGEDKDNWSEIGVMQFKTDIKENEEDILEKYVQTEFSKIQESDPGATLIITDERLKTPLDSRIFIIRTTENNKPIIQFRLAIQGSHALFEIARILDENRIQNIVMKDYVDFLLEAEYINSGDGDKDKNLKGTTGSDKDFMDDMDSESDDGDGNGENGGKDNNGDDSNNGNGKNGDRDNNGGKNKGDSDDDQKGDGTGKDNGNGRNDENDGADNGDESDKTSGDKDSEDSGNKGNGDKDNGDGRNDENDGADNGDEGDKTSGDKDSEDSGNKGNGDKDNGDDSLWDDNENKDEIDDSNQDDNDDIIDDDLNDNTDPDIDPNPNPVPNPKPYPDPNPNPGPYPKPSPNPEPYPTPYPNPNPEPNPEPYPTPNPNPNPNPYIDPDDKNSDDTDDDSNGSDDNNSDNNGSDDSNGKTEDEVLADGEEKNQTEKDKYNKMFDDQRRKFIKKHIENVIATKNDFESISNPGKEGNEKRNDRLNSEEQEWLMNKNTINTIEIRRQEFNDSSKEES